MVVNLSNIVLSPTQKVAAQGIVEIFEQGKLGKSTYGTVTDLAGDTGGLTYGKHQTTINSGNLYLLIKAYTEDVGADFAKQFIPYMDRLSRKDASLADDKQFISLLKQAGTDPDMREAQDAFFDRVFWQRTVDYCRQYQFTRALSHAVIYDSMIHGSFQRVYDRVGRELGDPIQAGEIDWIKKYVRERREWLAGHSNRLLNNCVYRMDAFLLLLKGDNWGLRLPMKVRGVRMTPESLGMVDTAAAAQEYNAPAIRVSAESDTPPRLFRLTEPPMTGTDIVTFKLALAAKGFPTDDNDEYNTLTVAAVLDFQRSVGLRADGLAGNATKAKLGIMF